MSLVVFIEKKLQFLTFLYTFPNWFKENTFLLITRNCHIATIFCNLNKNLENIFYSCHDSLPPRRQFRSGFKTMFVSLLLLLLMLLLLSLLLTLSICSFLFYTRGRNPVIQTVSQIWAS